MADQSNPNDRLETRLNKLARELISILLVLILLGLLVFLNSRVAGYGGHWEVTDFMEIYLGGRTLLEGGDLYNPVEWEKFHQKYAKSYLNNPIFIYPLPAAFVFAPFALFSVQMGAAVWLLVNEVLLIVLISYTIRHTKMRSNMPSFLSMALIIGVYLPTILVIGSGQYSAFMLILILSVYLFLKADIDWAAGFCFALLCNRPNPILLVFPMLLVWAIFNRRYQFIWSSLLSGLALLALSLWISPDWINTWLYFTIGDSGKINSYGLTSQTLRGLMFDLGSGLSYSIQVALLWGISLLTILIAALVVIRKRDFRLDTLMALAVTISLCISPYAWNYDHMILLFPMLFILLRGENGSQKNRLLAWIGVIFVYMLLPYVIRYIEMIQYIFTLTIIVPYVVLALQLWVINSIPSAQPTDQRSLQSVHMSVS